MAGRKPRPQNGDWGPVLVGLSLDTLKQIFNTMIRLTNKKIIICGKFIELYEFERPFRWGFQVKPRLAERGELKERSDSSITRARQTLYRIILSNIDEKQKYKNLFATFTFKKNVKDLKIANYEFKKFIQRFNFFMRKKYKYITVVEFQKRGAIHYHTLFFNVPYVKNLHLKIEELWGQGDTNLKSITEIKNISAYLAKYIRKGFFDKRLSRNKAYFCSRNCIYPNEYRKSEDIDKITAKSIVKVSSSSYPSNKFGQIKKTLFKLI